MPMWTAGKPNRIEFYTKNYRQLRNVESQRNICPSIRSHQLIVQYPIVNPEKIYIQVTLYGLAIVYLYI